MVYDLVVKDQNGEGLGWQRDRMAEGLMGKEVRAGGIVRVGR